MKHEEKQAVVAISCESIFFLTLLLEDSLQEVKRYATTTLIA